MPTVRILRSQSTPLFVGPAARPGQVLRVEVIVEQDGGVRVLESGTGDTTTDRAPAIPVGPARSATVAPAGAAASADTMPRAQ